MNKLSWFIYATDIADNISFCCKVIIIFGVIGIVVATIIRMITDPDDRTEAAAHNGAGRFLSYSIPIMIIAAALVIIVPSRSTLVLIAASETAEMAIKSDGVQSVVNPGMDLIKTWIAEETNRLKKEMVAPK